MEEIQIDQATKVTKKNKSLRLVLLLFLFILVILIVEGGIYFFKFRTKDSGPVGSISRETKNSVFLTNSDNKAVVKNFSQDFPQNPNTIVDTSVEPGFLGFNQQSKNIINVYGILEKVDVNKKILTLNVGDEGVIDFRYNNESQFWLKPDIMRGGS